eukprot:jgi/Chrzof1/2785/Cz11g29100.t1
MESRLDLLLLGVSSFRGLFHCLYCLWLLLLSWVLCYPTMHGVVSRVCDWAVLCGSCTLKCNHNHNHNQGLGGGLHRWASLDAFSMSADRSLITWLMSR